MRIGSNPLRNSFSAYLPHQIGVASITFAPFLEGFFKEAIEVIDVHLQSIRLSTDKDVDLLVFDNGSCVELTEYLTDQHRAGFIDWLILSKQNLGKTGALNWIFSAMPNEYLVFTDSDVLFRAGWLQRSLEIFDSFERVGIVSAQPAFFDGIPGIAETADRMSRMENIQMSQEEPFPDALAEYCIGIGASDDVRHRLSENQLDVATNPNTRVRAIVGTTHMQFMLRKELARKLVPLPVTRALDPNDDFEINRRMEALGYLQLSLPDPLVYHMGNTLQGRHITEVDIVRQESSIPIKSMDSATAHQENRSFLKSIIAKTVTKNPGFKKIIRRLYSLLFDILYSDQN